jgi:tRNA C32,U32 (ribose-2'-O)-methylase TrmJ
MGNLGLSDLRLVGGADLDGSARAMACSCQDLRHGAVRHQALAPAIADCVLAIAMVSPMRARQRPADDLRRLRPTMLQACRRGRVALVFGSEQSGLSRDDVARCDLAASLHLPSAHPSLNLAQAVLLAGYELCRGDETPAPASADRADGAGREPPATHADVDEVLRHVAALLSRLDYDGVSIRDGGDAGTGRACATLGARILARCRALAQRAALTAADVRMLQGLLARIDQRLR